MQARQGVHQISPEARSKAVLEVHLRLDGGESPREAIAFLESRGLPPADARELVNSYVDASRRDNRQRGLVRLVLGGLCLLVSVPVVYSAVSSGGYNRGFAQAVSMVGLLTTTGLWLVYRGVVLVFSGHRASDD